MNEIIGFILWTILWFVIGYLTGLIRMCIYLYKE